MADKVDPRSGELTTANYGWVKPTVGASVDAWGGYINTDLDGIDSTVKSVSTVANAAQTSSQVDAKITAAAYILPTASASVLGGVMVDGTTVNIAGGVISAAGAVAVSAIAPSSPVAGSLWFDTNGGQMYVWYNDGNSSQWVPVVNQGYAASSAPLIVSPPVSASWTHRNWGANTAVADVANGVRLFDSSSAAVSNTVAGLSIVAPTAPYTIDANFSVTGLVSSNGYISAGLGWTDGTKAQVITPLFFSTSTGNAQQATLQVGNYATFATAAAIALGGFYFGWSHSGLWLRIADNGTTVSFGISEDGVSFLTLYSIAKASGYLGSGGYTNVGVFMCSTALNSGGSEYMTLRSWWVH